MGYTEIAWDENRGRREEKVGIWCVGKKKGGWLREECGVLCDLEV